VNVPVPPPRPVDLSVTLGSLTLANPVMPASGCFGPELGDLIALDRLGALVTKTIFYDSRSGNPAHRLAETPGGMLNSVGIPSPGMAGFRSSVLPRYTSFDSPVIVSVGGLSQHEYWDVIDNLDDQPIAAFELNVSCPNLEKGGLEIGTDPREVEEVTRGAVQRTRRPIFVKLTPNVTRIDEIAKAAEAGGAAAVTVANTFVGMQIDIERRTAILGNTIGGVSGPAIKPMALYLVYTVAQAVGIPVIGCGGICSTSDALEFLMAGAAAIQVGTATFGRPETMIQIIDQLPEAFAAHNETTAAHFTGSLVAAA